MMFKNKKLLTLMIEASELEDSVKKDILKSSDIAFEFHEHIKQLHGITSEEAEKLSTMFINSRIKDFTKKELKTILISLCEFYKFEKSEEFAESMLVLLDFSGVVYQDEE